MLVSPPSSHPAPPGIFSLAETAGLILQDHVLLLAGAEADLASLPPGRWIGGTAGAFLTPQGVRPAAGQILVTDLTALALATSAHHFSFRQIRRLGQLAPGNGFTVIIVPGCSAFLAQLAPSMLDLPGLYNAPVIGWVAGCDLATRHASPPKTFCGNGEGRTDRAAVLYVTLPACQFAQLHVANLFVPGTGPDISFPAPGLRVSGQCLIGGKPANLARYIAANRIDPRLPLTADQDGALVNISVLSSDEASGTVEFFAPVNPALTYRFAEDVLDYRAEFARAAAAIPLAQAVIACLGLFTLRYAGLETAGLPVSTPVSFGQIGYTVLNQTLTCLSVSSLETDPSQDPFA